MISAAIQQFLKEHPEARVLDLSLTYHWYDEIEAGRKKEEYRELKQFYFKRLYLDWHLNLEQGCYKGCDEFAFNPKECVLCKKFVAFPYDYVIFHRGRFSPTTMLVQCDGIRIGYGREDWGAERGKPYFVIQLGDKVL